MRVPESVTLDRLAGFGIQEYLYGRHSTPAQDSVGLNELTGLAAYLALLSNKQNC